MKQLSIKAQLAVFLCAFGLVLSFINKEPEFLFPIFICVISTLGLECIFVYFKEKRLRTSESAFVTGLILGFVLYARQPWWVFVLASIFAIGSKHLIRFKGKHVFNPAAAGVFLSILLLKANTQWLGAYIWYVIVPVGFYLAYRIRKLELIFSYAVVSLSLFGIQAVMQKVLLLNILGYFNYFFIFIMLIEPKTTPMKPIGKILFGAGIAVLIFILTNTGARFDVEIFSLLVFNLFSPVLNRIDFKRGGKL